MSSAALNPSASSCDRVMIGYAGHMDSFDPAAFIQANLPVVDVPFVPEIRIHKASPASGMSRLEERREAPGAPYWAYHWAGGLALARHILDHPDLVTGHRVLDLGTGSGIVAIAAAKAGATQVTATDIDQHAITAATLNASLNDVAVRLICDDVTAMDPPDVDQILVGDLLYERALAERVLTFLRQCTTKGIRVLVGDPGRAPFPRDQLVRIADYAVAETNAGTRRTGIFRLRGS